MRQDKQMFCVFFASLYKLCPYTKRKGSCIVRWWLCRLESLQGEERIHILIKMNLEKLLKHQLQYDVTNSVLILATVLTNRWWVQGLWPWLRWINMWHQTIDCRMNHHHEGLWPFRIRREQVIIAVKVYLYLFRTMHQKLNPRHDLLQILLINPLSTCREPDSFFFWVHARYAHMRSNQSLWKLLLSVT